MASLLRSNMTSADPRKIQKILYIFTNFLTSYLLFYEVKFLKMLSNCSVEKSTFDGVAFAFKHDIGRSKTTSRFVIMYNGIFESAEF